ncbi:hypothetical protein [Streptomyces sp. NPDC051098]|uniref:hypothetical protein n=1 Tax=Streptomyces sp. NPDC051098 TaxID=3155411 RepID=UPI0034285CBD
MDLTGVGVVVFLVFFFVPALSSVLKSIAFRNRAAGRAEMIRARAQLGRRGLEDTKGRQARKRRARG